MIRRSLGGSEQGFTLIELSIAGMLSLLVLLIVGGFLISSTKTQSSVRSETEAANLGQLIARSVEQGTHNATAVEVVTNSVTGAEMLVAREWATDPSVDPTQSSAMKALCQAWFFDPTGGGAIYTSHTKPAAPIPMPSGTPGAGWTLIGDGLTVEVSAASSTVFAAPSGSRVDLKFDVTNGSNNPVRIQTTILLPSVPTASTPCF